jgi:hypothetical protein
LLLVLEATQLQQAVGCGTTVGALQPASVAAAAAAAAAAAVIAHLAEQEVWVDVVLHQVCTT